MTTIEAVVPTVPGREHLLDACCASLEAHGIQPVIVHDSPSCGEGWEIGLARCESAVVALWADDFTIDKWDEETVLRILRHRIVVLCPTILNPDGSLQGAGGMGHDFPEGSVARNCICPIAERQVLEAFQPWPHLNHYCDTWITQRAIWAKRGPIVTRRVRLVHHYLSEWDSDEFVAWQQWLRRP